MKILTTATFVCLAVCAQAQGAAVDQATLDAKKAELEVLQQEIQKLRKVLEQYRRVRTRAHLHQRDICAKPYQAARAEMQIIQQRNSIEGYDTLRAQAKSRYGAHRLAMIDCVNASIARDGALRAKGITDYSSLKIFYDNRKDRAKAVHPDYKNKLVQARKLNSEIDGFGLPDIPEEVADTTTVRFDCGPHGQALWEGNKQLCKCDGDYIQLTPISECTYLPTGTIPGEDPARNAPGGVFGQSDEERE